MHTENLATSAQRAAGIGVYLLTVPNLFGGPADIQGWVQAPGCRPQYVGFVLASDGEAALDRLTARVAVFAADIELNLGPPPAAPAAQRLPKPKAPAKPKRTRYDFPDAGDLRAAFRLDVQRTSGLMRDLERAA